MKILKNICKMTACTLMLTTLASCGSGSGNVETTANTTTPQKTEPPQTELARRVCGVDYTELTYKARELDAWIDENSVNMENGPCTMDGIVRSPYFTLTANGVSIPIFMAKTTYDPHSFACIEVEGDADPELTLELTLSNAKKSVTILPESSGASCELTNNGKNVVASLSGWGSFSFVFDGERDRPLTVLVKPVYDIKTEGSTVIEPGDYGIVSFDEPGVYTFKKGVYNVEGLSINVDDVTVYFESGAHIICTAGEPTTHFVKCHGRKNVKMIGNGCFDLSRRGQGGGSTIDFYDCANIEYSGILVLNAASWTNCFTAVDGLTVSDVAVIGYRTYSDGIMVSDCRDASIKNCFVRTGDDGIEIKSTSNGKYKSENVIFEGCAVWTDKGIGYGVVYESNNDVSGVTWKNCSIGFASADWSWHLGALTVSIEGSNETISDHDIHFENIEIYKSKCAIVSVYMVNGGNVHDIYFENISCKTLELTSGNQKNAVELIIANPDAKPIDRFALDKLYFKNVTVGGEKFCEDMIGKNFPDDFTPNESLVEIK